MSRKLRTLLAVTVALLVLCGSFGAMTVHADTPAQAASTGTWKKVNNYFYYYQDGQKLTGLQQIGNSTYYFSDSGAQITGWRKLGSDYYYFKIANCEAGCMVKNKKVNGIKLDANGKAKLNSKRSKRKVKVMVRCAKLMDNAVRPGQTKAKKLKSAYKYLKKHFRKKAIHGWKYSKNWDLYYAEYMLNHKAGDCYCHGALFAYFANAIGCSKVVAVSSGSHGWAKVDNKVYDPSWSYAIGDKRCYAVKRSLSGKGGRPPWFAAESYKKDLRK